MVSNDSSIYTWPTLIFFLFYMFQFLVFIADRSKLILSVPRGQFFKFFFHRGNKKLFLDKRAKNHRGWGGGGGRTLYSALAGPHRRELNVVTNYF